MMAEREVDVIETIIHTGASEVHKVGSGGIEVYMKYNKGSDSVHLEKLQSI